jgi:hypothetical protein
MRAHSSLPADTIESEVNRLFGARRMLILLRGKIYKLQARAGALALLCVVAWLLALPAGAQVYSPSPWLRQEDPEWAAATGLWETDARRFFENWRNIVGEIGERYGERVEGWWFDDGILNYYYRSPDWKSLYLAARKGYPGRVVCWNSTDEPPATDFQDYQCGEEFVRDGFDVAMNRDGSFHGTLIRGGDGRIAAGAFQGMQAISTFKLDGGWFHIQENTEPLPPKRSAEELLILYQEMQAYGATPIINVLIFQDGTLAPRSLAVMRDFADRVGGPNASSSSARRASE